MVLGTFSYRHVLHNHYALQYIFKCDQCDFSTTTTIHLNTHLMQHLDKKPYSAACVAKLSEVGPKPWSTWLLPTVRLSV